MTAETILALALALNAAPAPAPVAPPHSPSAAASPTAYRQQIIVTQTIQSPVYRYVTNCANGSCSVIAVRVR